MTDRIAKILSANDTGATGGHQAGILVPRDPQVLAFFPKLDAKEYNPRVHLNFLDDSGTFWELAFIYYNNRFFDGTRNEYRLTRMTKYIRQTGLIIGDEVVLSHDTTNDRYRITYRRQKKTGMVDGVLKLGTSWRVITLE